jgi:REP element-mobilizing transposase RayT
LLAYLKKELDGVMARPLRIEYEGAFYHVTARGNERKKIFFSKSDYDKFKEYLREAQEKYGNVLHCYVLMTNHYHLLIETPNANMSKMMHYVNSSYTNYINRKRKRSGHLLQGRYKAILIDRDNYLVELSRYVHLNPVRAKVVAKPEDYPYTSYKSYVFKKKEDIVHRDLILGMVSKSRKDSLWRYKDFVERGIEESLEDPLWHVYGGVMLGSKAFIKEALSRLKEGTIEREHISHRRELRASYTSDVVIDAIAARYKMSNDDVLKDTREYRNIAIYLIKKLTSVSNRQIGGLFGDLSYSAVAKVYHRFSRKLKEDKSLRNKVKKIKRSLS